MRKDWAAEKKGRNERDFEPDMPPLENADYLVQYLEEIGPIVAAGMGSGPISELEILAWQFNTQTRLCPWESRVLRRLSKEYLTESYKAEKRDCPPPYGVVARRLIVAKKIDEFFG